MCYMIGFVKSILWNPPELRVIPRTPDLSPRDHVTSTTANASLVLVFSANHFIHYQGYVISDVNNVLLTSRRASFQSSSRLEVFSFLCLEYTLFA